ncbi:MAG TPA: 2OG-Fe(II) oxygenase [Polyangiales bacterium]|nr:2OG-Fe(II) oxygenase [Polyangiales bacterium]
MKVSGPNGQDAPRRSQVVADASATPAASADRAGPRAESLRAAFDARLAAIWDERCEASLDEHGYALLAGVLRPSECSALCTRYGDDAAFRKTVVMERHGFGRGEYRYFRTPLPPAVQALRAALYPLLVPTANRWWQQLGLAERFPATLDQCLERSHAAGQALPTPLLLRYGPGDYNCLHQDLYGAFWFPLQAAFLLDQPGQAFTGGEFVLVEQRPRMQSRPVVVPLERGDGVVFACNHRPRSGARGFHRTVLRHGVSEIRSGQRHTLGVIFHDAAT